MAEIILYEKPISPIGSKEKIDLHGTGFLANYFGDPLKDIAPPF
jgi:hypothetical protein